MKIRLAGLLLWAMLAPLAVLAACLLPLLILWGPLPQARQTLRTWDELANAGLFNGSAYESLSSHAWRDRSRWWAKGIIWITDRLQPGHCAGAFESERAIVEFIDRAG